MTNIRYVQVILLVQDFQPMLDLILSSSGTCSPKNCILHAILENKVYVTRIHKYSIFVANICKYNIFVAEILKYALCASASVVFVVAASAPSSATLLESDTRENTSHVGAHPRPTSLGRADVIFFRCESIS